MKKINRIWIYPFVLMGILLMITSTCKKDETETLALTTTAVSNITSYSATSGGAISSNGGSSITVRGVCWSKYPNPTISNSKTVDGYYGTGGYTSTLTALDQNTKYYVRAYGYNGLGTIYIYGNELTFTTSKDTRTGYAVGEGGTILKTTNGGSTWTPLVNGINYNFHSVYFIDANTGFVVGDEGHILKTSDGGINWSGLTTGTTNQLNSVYFTDTNTGYVLHCWSMNGNHIFKTSDGGTSWHTLSIVTNAGLTSVYFTDSNTGYAIGNRSNGQGRDGVIFKTIDGGFTWTELSQFGCYSLYSVFFTDANTGYLVGEVTMDGAIIGDIYNLNYFKTVNAGLTWSCIIIESSNTTRDLSLNSIYFPDANTGYAVGSRGCIVKTSDAGETWAELSSGITTDLNSVYFTDANTGYSVGVGGSIINTRDGGATWTTLSSGTIVNLNSVFFLKPK